MSENNQEQLRQENEQAIEELKRKSEAPASKKKRIMQIFKYLFLVLVAVFLIRYFKNNAADFASRIKSIDRTVFISAVLVFFVYKFMHALLFHYITVLNDCDIDWKDAVIAFLFSILGKYIPGKVFMLLARIPPYAERGRSVRKVTVCFFLENLCTLLGAAFLFILSLLFMPASFREQYSWVVWAAIGMIIVFLICLNPKILNFFLRIAGKLIGKKDMEISITYSQMLKVVFLFMLNWLVNGVGFYLICRSICPEVTLNYLFFVAGLFGLSVVIGILALFAPAGVGVREGILIAGLVLIISRADADAISIVARLWMTVSELIMIAAAAIINVIRKRKKA